MINKIKAVAFDLDGTLYYGDKVADGALSLAGYLKNLDIKVFYFTNNSSKTRNKIYEKLIGLGFELEINEVYTSAYATAKYLKKNNLNEVYCIGSTGLVEELSTENLNIVSETIEAKVVVIGLDIDFDYLNVDKIPDISSECKIIACNRDHDYPIEDGKLMPGCGQIVSALENRWKRKINYAVGKPNTFMIELLARDWNLINKDFLIVGDSYNSDIEMAKRYGSQSALIINENSEEIKDTNVVSNLREIEGLISLNARNN